MAAIRVIQANLHRARTANDVLHRRFLVDNLSIALVQEPWTNKNQIRGLCPRNCKLVYSTSGERPRTAILIGNEISFIPMTEFITKDLVAINVTIPTERGKQEAVIASAYFPGDQSDVPPEEVTDLVNYCRQKNLQLLIGCDANAHHISWGSTDNNERGELLLEWLQNHDLDISNRGSEPTFRNSIRQEVLDLTISTYYFAYKIKNWHVSTETSLSDHMHIRFDIEVPERPIEYFRNPRNTDWNLYKDLLSENLGENAIRINGADTIEYAIGTLNEAIRNSYEASCPQRGRSNIRDVPWWNGELTKCRRLTRKLENKAKKTGNWEEYKRSLSDYNKKLRKSKRETWNSFCENLNNTKDTARIYKVFAKEHMNQVGSLKKPDGTYTQGKEETLELLLSTHFPQCTKTTEHSQYRNEFGYWKPGKDDWMTVKEIVNERKIKWAINSFEPYKAPGVDGIFPALLQKGEEIIVPHLIRIFRAILAFRYIPNKWKEVKVVFIPKTGKKMGCDPKSYRPISLTSFILKTMEKLIDLHVRQGILKNKPLHKNQHAYQKGKSTVTALNDLTLQVERVLLDKEIALCAFIDIEGAFDNTTFISIENAMIDRGFKPSVASWITRMLSSRIIWATLGGQEVRVHANRGCPQGGVLSPLLWSLVVDSLLKELSDRGIIVQGYADDVAIMVKGKFEETVSETLQMALNIVQRWCERMGLRVNPLKTTVVTFTRRRKLEKLIKPKLFGTELDFSTRVKYLGVIIDSKLLWNAHIQKVINKATTTLFYCRSLVGKRWGLGPRMMHWIYTSIIRPSITYAACIWWNKTEEGTTKRELSKLQRMACSYITGAMKTCPTMALERLLNLAPLDVQIKGMAARELIRLKQQGQIRPTWRIERLDLLENMGIHRTISTIMDCIPVVNNFDQPFQIQIWSREEWHEVPKFGQDELIWYTDGSKTDEGVGSGVYGPRTNLYRSLGKTPSVFQSEIYAIEMCLDLIKQRGYNKKVIKILSDSRAALMALGSYEIKSQIVLCCLNKLIELSKINKITLLWVPGHRGIEGNERADALARKGSSGTFIGPDPFCGIPMCNALGWIEKWKEKKALDQWNENPGIKRAKIFLTEYTSKKTIKILSKSKREIRLLTGLLTGHCLLNYHLHKMGKKEDPTCRLCNEEDETPEHILSECQAISCQRQLCLGKSYLGVEELAKLDPQDILELLKIIQLDEIL